MRILHSRAFSSPPLVLSPVLSLLAMCSLTCTSLAQVRMNLRNNMQIDTLAGSWPVEANAFAVGDVDSDGDLDLLMAENNGASRIWLNDGDGGFTHWVPLPSYRSSCCALFDADGDGDLDALLAGGSTTYATNSRSTLYRNVGGGTFAPSATIPNHFVNDAFITNSVCVGDCDGDGDRDVVIIPDGTHVRYWRNDGTGTFTDQSAVAIPTNPAVAGLGTLADVEPDGDLDIVMGPSRLYRNNGQGVFTTEPGIPWPIPSPYTVAADVDGDTLVDEVGIANNVPYVRRNLGGGVFQNVSATWFEPHALVDLTLNHIYTHVACAVFDADGDGDPDLVTGGTEGRYTASTTVGIPPKLFLNSNGQRFVDGGRPALPMLQTTATAVAAGDVDGDGKVELLFGYEGWVPPAPSVWKQDAAGRFFGAGHHPFAASLGPFGPPFATLALADVDADGDLDLIGISGSPPYGTGLQHRLALNDGSGNFTDVTATHMPPVASLGLSCTAGDVDADNDLDLVIGSDPYGPGVPLILLRNNGAGVFTNASAQLPPTPCAGRQVALRDFDGDGDLDLAAPGPYGSYPIRFFVNDGGGNFADVTASRVPATGSVGGGMSATDLDSDGDLDIAVGNVDLINNGTGTFTGTMQPFTRMHVLDLDENGTPDGILDSPYSVSIAGGQGLFSDYGLTGHTVLPVDLDRDADLDLVVCPLGIYNDWTRLRIELLYNLRRDVRVATLPRLGFDYRLQLRATNGGNATVAIVALATATLPQPVALFDWGWLHLDPGAMAVIAAPVIPDADTTAEVAMPIPNQPSLFGLPLTCQALFLHIGSGVATHLSNAMTYLLER